MKLDIIVPHYKEPWDVCRYLFSSLELQRGVPFNMVRVIVVNDGSNAEENTYAAVPWLP